ncbi:MAG: putative acyltransferase [Phycisphaerales bacterium]|nr:putative acyltransferase [Phycisphaerales bacterium]
MKDWFYYLVYFLGSQPLLLTSSPVVLHRDRARRKGAYLLAATHFSPYDVACLIKQTPRVLDFVSIVEAFRNPLAAWFLSKMGAFPLDRWKPDSPTVRTVLERLRRGRVVALFPEGHIRTEETSVLVGGSLKSGIARIAKMAGVPIIPCVVVGTRAYHRAAAWVPRRRVRYGVIYGEPITVTEDPTGPEKSAFEERLRQTYQELFAELKATMRARNLTAPWMQIGEGRSGPLSPVRGGEG